jgi:hypothetical protein
MKSGYILQYYPFANGLEAKSDRKAFINPKCEWFQRCMASQTIHMFRNKEMDNISWHASISRYDLIPKIGKILPIGNILHKITIDKLNPTNR